MSKDLSKKNVDRLIETGLIIADEEPSGAAIGYMHAVLSQVGLPRSKFDGRLFERTSGGASLVVEAAVPPTPMTFSDTAGQFTWLP